jgi:hypothetical protein
MLHPSYTYSTYTEITVNIAYNACDAEVAFKLQSIKLKPN